MLGCEKKNVVGLFVDVLRTEQSWPLACYCQILLISVASGTTEGHLYLFFLKHILILDSTF